jgi:hypothetical protein
MMKVKLGDTTKYIYFVLTSSVDHVTRVTGTLSGVSLYYSANGGSATELLLSVTEVDATFMPGVYKVPLSTAGLVATEGMVVVHLAATGVDPETASFYVEAAVDDQILDEVISSSAHNTSSTVGKLLREIHAMLLNKQLVSETAITTYEADGITPIAVHSLSDTGATVTKTRTT